MKPQRPSCCRGCPLEFKSRGFVRYDGTGSNGIMLVGESLGQTEVFKGKPFVGQAGAQLNRTLDRMHLLRDQFLIVNQICCHPPGNKLENTPWEVEAVAHCMPNFIDSFHRFKPRVIMPMGNVAMKYLIDRVGVTIQHGYVHQTYVDSEMCHVVPTIHPSFIIQGNDNYTPVQMFDISRALTVAREGWVEPEYHYVERPSVNDVEEFINVAITYPAMTCDIETPMSHSIDEDNYGNITDADIIRVSFAYKPHHAITIPFTREFQLYIKQLLAHPFEMITFWNADFDVPRLEAKGMMIGGLVVDMMECWHFVHSDLPRKLAFVAPFYTKLSEWKSLSIRYPEFYSCRDSDAQIQLTFAIKAQLEREGRWDAFMWQVVDLTPRLKQMSRAGVLIDDNARQTFRAELDADLQATDALIQEIVPVEVKTQRLYKCPPKGAVVGGTHTVAGKTGVWHEAHSR